MFAVSVHCCGSAQGREIACLDYSSTYETQKSEGVDKRGEIVSKNTSATRWGGCVTTDGDFTRNLVCYQKLLKMLGVNSMIVNRNKCIRFNSLLNFKLHTNQPSLIAIRGAFQNRSEHITENIPLGTRHFGCADRPIETNIPAQYTDVRNGIRRRARSDDSAVTSPPGADSRPAAGRSPARLRNSVEQRVGGIQVGGIGIGSVGPNRFIDNLRRFFRVHVESGLHAVGLLTRLAVAGVANCGRFRGPGVLMFKNAPERGRGVDLSVGGKHL